MNNLLFILAEIPFAPKDWISLGVFLAGLIGIYFKNQVDFQKFKENQNIRVFGIEEKIKAMEITQSKQQHVNEKVLVQLATLTEIINGVKAQLEYMNKQLEKLDRN